jgi:hypothetical protein
MSCVLGVEMSRDETNSELARALLELAWERWGEKKRRRGKTPLPMPWLNDEQVVERLREVVLTHSRRVVELRTAVVVAIVCFVAGMAMAAAVLWVTGLTSAY